MIYWDIEKLKKELINDRISDHEAYKYLLATIIFYPVLAIDYTTTTVNRADTISDLLYVLVAAYAVVLSYQYNGGKNGVRFLQRYTALTFVVGVRWVIMVVVPTVLAKTIIVNAFPLFRIPVFLTTLDIFVSLGLELVYLYLLVRSINHVARGAA